MRFNLLLHSEHGWVVGFESKLRPATIAYFAGFDEKGERKEVSIRANAVCYTSYEDAERIMQELAASEER